MRLTARQLLAGKLLPIWDARREKPELIAVMTDACTKMSHLRTAGRQHEGLQRTRSIYYGAAHDIIASATAAKERVGPEVRAGADAEWEPTACDSHLTCARLSAQPHDIVDVHGILCFYCTHGQPAEGSLVDLFAPEQFRYALF